MVRKAGGMSPDGNGATATWIRLPAEHRHGSQRVLRSGNPAARGMAEGWDTLHIPCKRAAFGPYQDGGREDRELGAVSSCRKREALHPCCGRFKSRAVSAQHAHGVGAVCARALATGHGSKVGPERNVRLEASTREFQERSALGPELFP